MSGAERDALPPAHLPASAIFSDAFVIARRNLLDLIRTPQLLVFSTIQPVMFVLLFRYVFGGAISVPTTSYASYLLPGVFVQTVVFGSTTTAVALAYDLKARHHRSLPSLPMARSAVLAGRTAADAVRNVFVIMLMVVVGYAVGFRFQGGPLAALGAMVIALLFGYAFSWFFALVGMLVGTPRRPRLPASCRCSRSCSRAPSSSRPRRCHRGCAPSRSTSRSRTSRMPCVGCHSGRRRPPT